MSGSINFAGVDSAKELGITSPGTIAVFKIGEVKFDVAKNEKQTQYMNCVFEELDANTKKSVTSFNHTFYLSEGALPRVQSLMEAVTGKKATSSLTFPQIEVMLKGKEVALKVTGRVSTNGKGYPNLGFGGFCKPANEVQFLSFTKAEKAEIEATLEAIERSRSNNADSEGATTPGAVGAKDEAF